MLQSAKYVVHDRKIYDFIIFKERTGRIISLENVLRQSIKQQKQIKFQYLPLPGLSQIYEQLSYSSY